jgi:uncharacterized membrane protein HdeD (DUF308 family)
MQDKQAVRRIGSFTAGVTLVLAGIIYLLHLFVFKSENFLVLALNLWPIVLILLGSEILLSLKQKRKYDVLSVVIMIICLLLSFGCELLRMNILYNQSFVVFG